MIQGKEQEQSQELEQYYQCQQQQVDRQVFNQLTVYQQLLKKQYNGNVSLTAQSLHYLQSNNINCNLESFQEQISITVQQHTNNYQALKLNVSYGHFTTTINIINVDAKHPINSSAQSFVGGFGQVFKYYFDFVPIAIKAIKITNDKFQYELRQIIKEYLILMIASSLKIGPHLIKIFGFDIIIFRDSFVFSMEFCQLENSYINEPFQLLAEKLYLFHSLKIVHLDIKPQNILYSTTYDSYVFIDFGLSKIIKEQIGSKSYTNFVGSFNYCSAQMLELYLRQSFGFIDLYYNDAFCLNKTMKDFKGKDVYGCSEFYFKDQITSGEFNQCQIILKIKFILFQYSLGYISSQPKLLSRQLYFLHKNVFKFDSFINNLPQSLYFIFFYKNQLKKHLKIDEHNSVNDDQKIKRQSVDDKIPQLFSKRFFDISLINKYQQIDKQGQPYINLFDIKNIRKMKFELYKLALIKFININNGAHQFQQKINACLVFKQLYLKDKQLIGVQLYKKTIDFIVESSILNYKEQSYKIIFHCIQTITVLQILPQERFINAFISILQFELEFVPKARLIFEFVSSLQFIRQKYRTSYNYDKLIGIMMTNLHIYLNKIESEVIRNQYKEIIQKLRFIIFHKLPECQPDHIGSCCFDEKQIQRQQIQLKLLNQSIMLYLLYSQTEAQIDKFRIYKELTFKILLILLNKLKRFSFPHFLIFKITFRTNQNSLNHNIYQLFYSKFKDFEDHKYFSIYLLNKLNAVKKAYSKNFLLQRKEIHIVTPTENEGQIQYQQIFNILDYIINNSTEYHQYLSYLFGIPTISSSKNCIKFINKLIIKNRDKTTRLSYQFHKEGRQLHNNKLKQQIFVVGHIFQALNYCITPQEYLQQTSRFIIQCQKQISEIPCFQCKIHGLLELQQTYTNAVVYQQKDQQPFIVILDTIIVCLKNSELKAYVLSMLTTNLMRRWITSTFLYKKYDLLPFLYQVISITKQHHYCLIDSKQHNIFLHLYIFIARIHQIQDMIEFVKSLLDSLMRKKSVTFIQNFYYTLLHIIKMAKETNNKIDFIRYHHQIIQQFLRLKNYKKNYFFALYQSAFLQIQMQSQLKIRILQAISLSINFMDSYTKSLILNRYFYQFALQINSSKKQSNYLRNKHLKKSFDNFSLQFILKTRLNVKMGQSRQNSQQINLLRKFLGKYHENIKKI